MVSTEFGPLAYVMQLHQRLSSDMVGLLGMGFFPCFSFHFCSARCCSRNVPAIKVLSIVKYSLISQREVQRTQL